MQSDDDENKLVDLSEKSDKNLSMDAKYRSYVAFSANLDNLIWRNITNGNHVTMVGGGFTGAIFVSDFCAGGLIDLNRNYLICLVMMIMITIYGSLIYTMGRLWKRQKEIDVYIAGMEDNGYFCDRVEARGNACSLLYSAITWSRFVFFVMIAVCIFVFMSTVFSGHLNSSSCRSKMAYDLKKTQYIG